MVLLLLFGIILLGIGVAACAQIGKRASENGMFTALGIVFLVLGFFFSWFGIWVYRKMEAFYKSGKWYGITINGNQLVSNEFDLFKVRSMEINRTEVQSFNEYMYKGRLYLQVKTAKRLYALPIIQLALPDRQRLKDWLVS